MKKKLAGWVADPAHHGVRLGASKVWPRMVPVAWKYPWMLMVVFTEHYWG